MAKWRKSVVTDYGEDILAEAVTGESIIEFVKISVGCGIYSGDELSDEFLKKRTSIREEKNEYGISSMKRNGNVITISAIMDNASVSDGYYIRELGLWAKRKDSDNDAELYSIIIADEPDYFPESSSPTTVKHTFQMVLANDDMKICITENMGAYVLVDDYNKDKDKIEKALYQKVETYVMEKSLEDAVGDANQFTLDKIAELINGAPETRDTLKEIADAIADNETVVDALNAAIGSKLDKTEGEELKKSVRDGKSSVASAITSMGVTTASDATFSTMSDNIKKVTPTISQSGQVVTAAVGNNKKTLTVSSGTLSNPAMSWNGATLTATSKVETAGYIGTSEQKSNTATITTQAARTVNPGKTAQTIRSAGSRVYFSGAETVGSLGGTASASDVASGVTFSSDLAGRNVTGTLKGLKFTQIVGEFTINAQDSYKNFQSFSPAISRFDVYMIRVRNISTGDIRIGLIGYHTAGANARIIIPNQYSTSSVDTNNNYYFDFSPYDQDNTLSINGSRGITQVGVGITIYRADCRDSFFL